METRDSDRRIIEDASFPVKAVSEHGSREKKKQITGLHTWWARRPLGASRATCYAALVSPTKQTGPFKLRKHQFIAELSKSENLSNPLWVTSAQTEILEEERFAGEKPKVLDPFGGAGSIPLEAQRLGCETHSCDLNPVAVLIQKCLLEYPQKYRECLHDDVRKWGEQILNEVTDELKSFYPKDPDGSSPIAYIWARTLPCQNIRCGAAIPLLKQFWLAKKKKKRVALFPYESEGQVAFRLVGTGTHDALPDGFDPSKATVRNAVVTCPLCKSTISAKETRALFQEGNVAKERMVAVVTLLPNNRGRQYRLATDTDEAVFTAAQKQLAKKREFLAKEWGLDPVPDEAIPEGIECGYRVSKYHFSNYGSLFNSRQQLTLVTLVEKIRAAHSEMSSEEGNQGPYATAVATYLGLWLNRIADIFSSLCRWRSDSEAVVGVFGRSGLPMVWDYAEAHLASVSVNRLKEVLNTIKYLAQIRAEPAKVKQASAAKLPVEHYPDAFFDAVLTDPPYYNNIPYAYLSDFFYVWLKRSIGAIHPELFKTELTPKKDEIVAYSHREGGMAAGKRFFEEGLRKAFAEIHRVLKPNGIAVIVYAHKSNEGWETLINALLDSEFVITAAWSIETELKGRLVAQNTASLSSSIYMVARKKVREPLGMYKDVMAELKEHLQSQCSELWESGISGADLSIAAIGSALQVFSKYEEVMDYEGTLIRAENILTDIRELIAAYDPEKIHVATSSISAGPQVYSSAQRIETEATPLTLFYHLWRKEHGEKELLFDEANQLARSLGIDLSTECREGNFIRKEGASIRVLAPHERHIDDVADSEELIDILHHALLLWRSNERAEMFQCLARNEVGVNELIYNVAQAVSLALPLEAEERRWLEAWIADRETVKAEVTGILKEQAQETLSLNDTTRRT